MAAQVFSGFAPLMKNLPRVVTMRVERALPTHATLIAETTVYDDTAGVSLIPQCIWTGQQDNGDQFSVWVWLKAGNVEAVCVITSFVRDGVAKIGMEIARISYNQLTIMAREQTATLPFVTALPAIGYMAFGWDAV